MGEISPVYADKTKNKRDNIIVEIITRHNVTLYSSFPLQKGFVASIAPVVGWLRAKTKTKMSKMLACGRKQN